MKSPKRSGCAVKIFAISVTFSELMAHAVATGRLVDMADFIRDTAKWL